MDTGTRKSTIALTAVTALLAAGQYVPAVVVAVFYIGVNALLHLKGVKGVEEG